MEQVKRHRAINREQKRDFDYEEQKIAYDY